MSLDFEYLRRFTGLETWHRHSLNPTVLYTDGAKHVAERADAYWLLDEIALAQRYERAVRAEARKPFRSPIFRNPALCCGALTIRFFCLVNIEEGRRSGRPPRFEMRPGRARSREF